MITTAEILLDLTLIVHNRRVNKNSKHSSKKIKENCEISLELIKESLSQGINIKFDIINEFIII